MTAFDRGDFAPYRPEGMGRFSLLSYREGREGQAGQRRFATEHAVEGLILNTNYHVLVLRWVAVDPSVMDVAFFSRNIPAPGKFKFNWARFGSPQLDAWLNEADAAIRPERRNEVLARIQKFVLDRALIFPIHVSPQPIGHRRALQNLKFAQGFWQVLFYDATLVR